VAIASGANVNGWVYDPSVNVQGIGSWTWSGDPNVHRVGERQGGNFNPRTGDNYVQNAGSGTTSTAMNKSAAQAGYQSTQPAAPDQALIHSNTLRTLELLRQNLGQGAQYSTNRLRSNLAQRGLMDSGSLGAGIGRINSDYGNQMAQGTMHAANNENDALLRLLEEERNRQAQMRAQQAGFAHDQQMMALQNQYAQQNKPSWMDYLLGAGGQAAGTALGYKLGALVL
jgi:hypothetical protein